MTENQMTKYGGPEVLRLVELPAPGRPGRGVAQGGRGGGRLLRPDGSARQRLPSSGALAVGARVMFAQSAVSLPRLFGWSASGQVRPAAVVLGRWATPPEPTGLWRPE